MIASKLPVAILEQNLLRFSFWKSVFLVTSRLAFGYNNKNSDAHCSVRWFGTTIIDFWHKPRYLDSIAAAAISNVLPAPTQCANKVLYPYNICATAPFWCGLNLISGFIPW